MRPLKKIVVIGPESTGKSSLCLQLARHYDTVWVPEFAREYLEEHGMDYSYDDLLTIAQGQLEKEDRMAAAARNGLLIVDTDMHVMKVWCEFVFGQCHPWILEQLASRKYDLYLLCQTDLPWVKDNLREYPDEETRNRLFDMYRSLMQEGKRPWAEVSGTGPERLLCGIAAVDGLLKPLL